jgi:hypothetical protein
MQLSMISPVIPNAVIVLRDELEHPHLEHSHQMCLAIVNRDEDKRSV